jgi:hypothetical protein
MQDRPLVRFQHIGKLTTPGLSQSNLHITSNTSINNSHTLLQVLISPACSEYRACSRSNAFLHAAKANILSHSGHIRNKPGKLNIWQQLIKLPKRNGKDSRTYLPLHNQYPDPSWEISSEVIILILDIRCSKGMDIQHELRHGRG